MPGAESPFSQQCKIFLDNLGRSSTCSSLLAVELTMVYRHGFQCTSNSYVLNEECKWKKKSVRSTIGGICGVRTQRRSHHNHTGHPVETSGCGHATFGFRRAPSCSYTSQQHERGGAYWQTKALQTSRLSPNFHLFPNCAKRQNDDLRFCLPCEKCEWWGWRERAPVTFLKESFADEETCRDWYLIEHAGRWLDQRVAILADNHFVVMNSAISFQVFFASWSTSSSFSCSLQQRWPAAEIGLGCARDDRRARCPRLAQLLRFVKTGNCACVKISPRVWGILGDENRSQAHSVCSQPSFMFSSHWGFSLWGLYRHTQHTQTWFFYTKK